MLELFDFNGNFLYILSKIYLNQYRKKENDNINNNKNNDNDGNNDRLGDLTVSVQSHAEFKSRVSLI